MEVRYARHTPHFWRFPGEFKSLEKLDASPDILKAFEEQALAPENHLLLAALLKYGLPEGTERMLWVPPTKCDTLQGIFKEYRRFGKTLAFTHYHMAAKAIGVLVSEEAEQRLSRVQAAEKASRLTLTGLDYPAECVRQCVSEEAISAVYQSINKARDPQKEPIYSLEEDLECFFWQPYARAAIQAELESCGAADTQNVELYCKNGGFLEMLLEYQGRFEKDADFLRSLHTVLRAKRGSCKLRSSKGGTVFEYSAAVYYTDDDTDSDSHKKDYEKELAEGFKSPVFPLVMAVTATAQEGLNLHEYADKLMHWQPSVNVNAFQQREGRVDRPNSLTIRRRYCDIMKAFPEQNAAPSSDNMVAAEKRFWTSMETNMTHPDRYEKIRSSLPDETARQQLDHAREAGLYPKWYIPEISKSDAKIQRIIAVSEYNADHDVFMRLLDGTKAYSKFMEHVDEKALCPFYRQKKLSADEAEKNG